MGHKETDLHIESAWECIDPSLGQCLGELDLAETSEKRVAQLQAHLDLCEGCRLDRALTQRLERGLHEGELQLPNQSRQVIAPRPWYWRPAALVATGSTLLAACLALLVFLPPLPTGDDIHVRGGHDQAGFLRPVEGEVVVPGAATISWSPIEGATRYQIVLTDIQGDIAWQESTTQTEVKLPTLASEVDGGILRAVLATVPSDLLSPGQVSVSFKTGSKIQVAQDRLAKAPLWLGLLGLAGLVMLGLSFRPNRKNPGSLSTS